MDRKPSHRTQCGPTTGHCQKVPENPADVLLSGQRGNLCEQTISAHPQNHEQRGRPLFGPTLIKTEEHTKHTSTQLHHARKSQVAAKPALDWQTWSLSLSLSLSISLSLSVSRDGWIVVSLSLSLSFSPSLSKNMCGCLLVFLSSYMYI